MDISKASNFERFIFDFVGRDKTVIRDLWKKVERGESFDLTGTVYWQKRDQFGFVSGRSTHADRLQNIRHAYEKYGRIIDPHTADAMHLALTQRKTGESLVVLETAQAAKFEEIIQAALGISPPRPALMEGIEKQPQHVVVCDVNAEEIKKFIMEKAE